MLNRISIDSGNGCYRMQRRMLVMAGAALLCGTAAFGQTSGMGVNTQTQAPPSQAPNQEPTSGMSPMDKNMATMGSDDHTMTDKLFVRTALQGGMAEVDLGQLAVSKSSNPDVKNFAQKMIDDHTKLGNDMKAVAEQVGVKPPKGPSKKDMELKAKLEALNGDEFDKAYIKAMVKDHEQDEKDFKDESMNATIQAVKDAATKGEQVISMHLEMIKQIAQTNNVASK